MNKINILLVDDHQIVRRGIAFYLALQPDFELVGEVSNGQEAVEQAAELNPDVILMDLNMPVMDGIEATRRILERDRKVRILMLTSFSDRSHIVPALQAGAAGYILKDVEPDQLAEAIRSAYKGMIQLHPDIAAALVQTSQPQPAPPQTWMPLQGEVLTRREREVLMLVARGMSNKEIAAELTIAEKTVKSHVSSILAKLHVTDRTQAALYAVQSRQE
ncbi:response regulator [Paenibacillus sp. JSM ZJ436]|uniref:response regulator n=1 Tax=Paenibacillus sp. JSM ZJ436 TaxID=3376190 RepID=UPI00378C4065